MYDSDLIRSKFIRSTSEIHYIEHSYDDCTIQKKVSTSPVLIRDLTQSFQIAHVSQPTTVIGSLCASVHIQGTLSQ
jgi:hypothetical protein